MIVLGIEASCDESAVALLRDGRTVLADGVASQVAAHAVHGGVVPELAARHHGDNLPFLHDAVWQRAGWTDRDRPDVIAVTHGPGLLSSLNVGIGWALGLGAAWGVPVIGVNHLDAHLLVAAGLDFPCPHLGLLVSGGHTLLVLRRGPFDSVIIGETIDDAVGEAYDKVARLLGLGYPGGPLVDKLAAAGDPAAVKFALPVVKGQPFNVSLSGLKTAVLYLLRGVDGKGNPRPPRAEDVAAAFQATVLAMLFDRVARAGREYNCRRLCLGGGVAANSGLRARAEALRRDGWEIALPPVANCLDNGTMIALQGYVVHTAGRGCPPAGNPNLRFGT